MDNDINIEVVYAQAEFVWRAHLKMARGSTVEQALAVSEWARHVPAYQPTSLAVGIFGQACTPDRVLADGDRIEIYRPLTFDPMESRRRRAVHRKAFMTKRLSRT